MFQSSKEAIGSDKWCDGPCLRSRFDNDNMEFPLEGQGGEARFAPKISLDRAGDVALESLPERRDVAELGQAPGQRIQVPVFAVTRVRTDRNSGPRVRDTVGENELVVSAKHVGAFYSELHGELRTNRNEKLVVVPTELAATNIEW